MISITPCSDSVPSLLSFLILLCLRKRGSLLRDLKRVLQPLLLLWFQIGKLNGGSKGQLTTIHLITQGLFEAVKPDIAMNHILANTCFSSNNLVWLSTSSQLATKLDRASHLDV